MLTAASHPMAVQNQGKERESGLRHVPDLPSMKCKRAHIVVVADDDKVDGRQLRVLHRQSGGNDAFGPKALRSAGS